MMNKKWFSVNVRFAKIVVIVVVIILDRIFVPQDANLLDQSAEFVFDTLLHQIETHGYQSQSDQNVD